jgi:hypothetical protein
MECHETKLRLERHAEIWDKPAISKESLDQLAIKNASLFEFEKALQQTEENLIPQMVMTIQ